MSEPLFVIRVMCFDFFLSLFFGSNTLFPALLLVASTIQSLCQWCSNFPTRFTKASGYHKVMSLLPCKSANLVKDKLNDWTATGLMKRGKSSTHSSSDPYVCWYFNLVSLLPCCNDWQILCVWGLFLVVAEPVSTSFWTWTRLFSHILQAGECQLIHCSLIFPRPVHLY